MLWLALSACTPTGVVAIVDAERGESWLDVPFPSDARLAEGGHPDLSGFPQAPGELAAPIIDGWARRLEQTASGYGNHSASYFRFEGALDLPAATEGLPDDPVVMVALDGSHQLPLELRFIADPQGDPFWAANTLAVAPRLGHPPRSGGTYAVVVMRSAGVSAPDGYVLPDEVAAAIEAAGIDGKPVVATVFTVQDGTDQLRQLVADVDTRLGDWSGVTLRRVTRLTIAQGTTPEHAKDATIVTATFEDGATRAAYLGDVPDQALMDIDLGDPWPFFVYEADLPVWNYSGDLDDRPYMSPGLATIGDDDRFTGWIDFEDGLLTSEPVAEVMRITIQIPKDADGNAISDAPVLIWDHGTGGHAYNAVRHRIAADQSETVAELIADAGYAVIGRDASLYGVRYPLIDEGFNEQLGFYNVVNLPAFRDNQRQTAIDGHVLTRFVQDGLNARLPAGSVDPAHIRRYGHSLGSVTANLGTAAAPDDHEAVFLNGTGGIFAHYFLDTGMLQDLDPSLLDSLFSLVGAEPPDEVTAPAALGAILGLPEPAWARLDRLHPVIGLFQWTMDPSDAMSVAGDETVPAQILLCVGDHQVPNFTTRGLAEALPDVQIDEVTPTSEGYDPHQCLHREPAAQALFADWLANAP